MTEWVQEALDALQSEWGFDITSGTVQIEPIALDRMKTNPLSHGYSIGSGQAERSRQDHIEHAQRDYGRLQQLEELATEWDLVVSYVPPSHGTRRKIGKRRELTRYVSDAQQQAALDAAKARRS